MIPKFNRMEYNKVINNSMYEEDVLSELRYKDLCMSDKGRNVSYDDLKIVDFEVSEAEEDRYLFEEK
jgi:hypothetical protein